MTLPNVLAAGALAATVMLAVAGSPPTFARDLTIVSSGGPLQAAQREVYFRPFSETTGIAVAEASWDGGLDVLRQKVAENAPWDVVLVDGHELQPACDGGMLEKLDWQAIGGKDHYLPLAGSDCGVGAFLHSTVLAWDRDKFQGTPTWADFWDVAKVPGKRGLMRGPKTNLEIALLADGVSPGDVYATLRSRDGADRAFRKLDQLKPYVVWWQASLAPAAHASDSQAASNPAATGGAADDAAKDKPAAQILGSGEVLMTSAPSDSIVAANRAQHRNFGIQWIGALDGARFWTILKASPNVPSANKFLAFVGDSKTEAKVLTFYAVGGLAKGANDGLPPDLLAVSPSAPANLTGALMIDEQFWRENQERLSKRFDEWLQH
jgi:putative spermidine/putrescine transport system substrate-binding protein